MTSHSQPPASAGPRGFSDPRVLLPFLLVTLIWGSTWIVIRDQIGPGSPAPAWSVTYRFAIAAAAMFAWAAASGAPLAIGRAGHRLALMFGIPQFSFNFLFVYAAEHYVTSGLVATVFALLMVPNSAFAWIFLRAPVSRAFILGSAVACLGVAMLFANEMRLNPAGPWQVGIGIGLTLVAVLSASAANIIQASRRAAAWPLASLLAWGMVYGLAADALTALLVAGPPEFSARPGYWAGLLYLGLAASALAFPLYFAVMRAVGPGKAAYSSMLVPILAMGFSTLIEDYRWTALAVAGGAIALGGMAVALRTTRPAS